MKILITGSSGMLGQALCGELSGKCEVAGLDVERVQSTEYRVQKFIKCDITEREKTIAAIAAIKPDVVIHTAAYTDVDGCEQNPKEAHKVNALGTETIALACRKCRSLLCYISTDFVFDGKKESAYLESDQPRPLNIYGRSKLAGERYVQTILKEFLIVRSSWLFGQGGKNFVLTILKKAQTEKIIEVVSDQFGSPTYAQDLAEAVSNLIDLTAGPRGIYHITNSGSCSWYEFAQAIKELAGLDMEFRPVSSAEYLRAARRPRMSILDNRRYRVDTGNKLRHWKEALEKYLQEQRVAG